jgi:hypothetical protein
VTTCKLLNNIDDPERTHRVTAARQTFTSLSLSEIAGDAPHELCSVAVCFCSKVLLTPVPKPAREAVSSRLSLAENRAGSIIVVILDLSYISTTKTNVRVYFLGETKDALPLDLDEAVYSAIATHLRLAKQCD